MANVAGREALFLLDITRLLARVRRGSASGIDRVELEYLLYFLGSHRASRFVVWSGPVLRTVPRWVASLLATHLTRTWFGQAEAEHRLKEARIGVGSFPGVSAVFRRVASRKRLFDLSLRATSSNTRGEAGVRVYLNVSHRNLERWPELRGLLGLGTVTVALVHDIMPVLYPHYFPPSLRASFESGMRALCASIDLVVANSRATADEVEQWAASAGVRTPRIAVSRLGVRIPAMDVRRSSSITTSPYFVFLGTVSPRKNVAVLLRAWTVLMSEAANPPRLLVIGAEAVSVREEVARVAPQATDVIEVYEGLDDAAVFSLLRDSSGLLMPSRAEGFGLPVAEALALGVPVVCSDIPALREFEGRLRFLDPDDADAWATAARELSAPAEPDVPQAVRTWAEHIEDTIALSLRLSMEETVR